MFEQHHQSCNQCDDGVIAIHTPVMSGSPVHETPGFHIFFSILILLEILTLPLHHHFLLASQPPYLPPPTVSHTHTHARRQAGRHMHKYTHAPAALSFARSLSLSSHLSHVYTQLADRNVRGRGITDLVQAGKT